MQDEQRLFHEEQAMRSVWWVMLLVMGIAAMMWWGFVQQIVLGRPWGSNPAPDWMMWLFSLAFGVGLPLFFLRLRLIVDVFPEVVVIRYLMLTTRRIATADIASFKALTYRPLRDYGGWGVRGMGRRVAYNVKGNQGVELVLRDGRVVLIGTQEPQALALALTAATNQSSGKADDRAK